MGRPAWRRVSPSRFHQTRGEKRCLRTKPFPAELQDCGRVVYCTCQTRGVKDCNDDDDNNDDNNNDDDEKKGYLRRHVRTFGQRSIQDFVVHHTLIPIIEGRQASDHLVNQRP